MVHCQRKKHLLAAAPDSRTIVRGRWQPNAEFTPLQEFTPAASYPASHWDLELKSSQTHTLPILHASLRITPYNVTCISENQTYRFYTHLWESDLPMLHASLRIRLTDVTRISEIHILPISENQRSITAETCISENQTYWWDTHLWESELRLIEKGSEWKAHIGALAGGQGNTAAMPPFCWGGTSTEVRRPGAEFPSFFSELRLINGHLFKKAPILYG